MTFTDEAQPTLDQLWDRWQEARAALCAAGQAFPHGTTTPHEDECVRGLDEAAFEHLEATDALIDLLLGLVTDLEVHDPADRATYRGTDR